MSASPELRLRNLCFLDVETTGSMFGFNEIIDIGAIRTTSDGLKVKDSWSCRLRPRHPERLTDRAREVNGFSEREWAAAKKPSKGIWSEFADFVEGCVPVAHNPSFDRAFITLGAAAEGVVDLKLDYHWIGTESLAWRLYLSGELTEMSLGGICDLFGIPREGEPHRAMNGAITCQKVYCALMARQLVHR